MGWSTFNGHQIWMFLSLPKFCLGLEAITSSARRKRKWSTDYSKPPESRPSTLLNSSPFRHSPAPGVSFVKLLSLRIRNLGNRSKRESVNPASNELQKVHILLSFSRSYLSQCDPSNLLYDWLIWIYPFCILLIMKIWSSNKIGWFYCVFWNDFA